MKKAAVLWGVLAVLVTISACDFSSFAPAATPYPTYTPYLEATPYPTYTPYPTQSEYRAIPAASDSASFLDQLAAAFETAGWLVDRSNMNNSFFTVQQTQDNIRYVVDYYYVGAADSGIVVFTAVFQTIEGADSGAILQRVNQANQESHNNGRPIHMFLYNDSYIWFQTAYQFETALDANEIITYLDWYDDLLVTVIAPFSDILQ